MSDWGVCFFVSGYFVSANVFPPYLPYTLPLSFLRQMGLLLLFRPNFRGFCEWTCYFSSGPTSVVSANGSVTSLQAQLPWFRPIPKKILNKDKKIFCGFMFSSSNILD